MIANHRPVPGSVGGPSVRLCACLVRAAVSVSVLDLAAAVGTDAPDDRRRVAAGQSAVSGGRQTDGGRTCHQRGDPPTSPAEQLSWAFLTVC